MLSQGHHPIALVRESSHKSTLPAQTEVRSGDLTDLPETVCDDCDAVIFAAGAGGGTSDERADKIDRDGAKRHVDIAAKALVARCVPASGKIP